MAQFSIGVDLGGTNLRIAAVDEHGRILETINTATEVKRGRDAVVKEMCDAIRSLALKHHSVVELIDRLEAHGYVRRSRSRDDRRRVLVSLLPRGEKLLEQVVRNRIDELRTSGTALVEAIRALLERRSRDGNKSAAAKHKRPARGNHRA